MARPSVFAGAARAFAASVAIMAVTKPTPPAQSELGKNEAAASWAQGPNSMHFLLLEDAGSGPRHHTGANYTREITRQLRSQCPLWVISDTVVRNALFAACRCEAIVVSSS